MLMTTEKLYDWLTKKREEVVNNRSQISTQITIDKFTCDDGTEISIQASRTHYAGVKTDAENVGKSNHNVEAITDATYYASFEVYMPNGSHKTKKMAEFINKDNDSAGFVPIQYIVDEINAHNHPSEMDQSLLIGSSNKKEKRCTTPRTRNRIHRYEKEIIKVSSILEAINKSPKSLTYSYSLKQYKRLVKYIEHLKNEIQDKHERYGDALKLTGITKQNAEIQQKIHNNKIKFRELNKALEKIKDDLKQAIDLSKNGNEYQKEPYSDVWLEVNKLRETKFGLEVYLKGLHKEQFALKAKLRKNYKKC